MHYKNFYAALGLYQSSQKNLNFGCAKAPGFNDLKRCRTSQYDRLLRSLNRGSFRISPNQIFLGGLVLLFVTSCHRICPPDASLVDAIIDERIQKESHWDKSYCHTIHDAICYLLANELTAESALQIALLNNPQVQALYDEIGIAHADLIEAGLFRNPIFDGYFRFPDQSGLVLNTEFSIAQTFLDIFLVPLKKRVARAELEQTKLQVADAILNLGFDVQAAFHHYIAIQKKHCLIELLVEAADVSHRLAMLQKKQGNINELELQARSDEYLRTKILLASTKADLIKVREQMNRLMGLNCDTCWQAIACEQKLPPQELSCEQLESIALMKRLDIGSIKWEIEKLSRLLKTKKWWAYADGMAGISSEREAEGFRETGPAFSLPIPFFNYGQADRARIYAFYHQTYNRLKALEITVLSQVRSARGQLDIYHELIEEYQTQLLPLQETILSTSQRFYNYMALGVYQLIEAKKRQIEIEIQYTMALFEYWKIRVELDRALGGNLQWARFQGVCHELL